jgi:outer membrane receptor protein involved in Fe transport
MKSIIYLLLLAFPICLVAQSNIKGRVTDPTGKTLDAVTITLTQNGKITGQMLANKGVFQFSGLKGLNYQISATLIGFQSVVRNFSLPKDTLNIIMQEDITKLKDVVITSLTPQVEHKSDRTTFNVQNSILASGGSVWDALNKAPGVQTTSGGQVTANNKGVTIYINDKPVQLTGENLSAYLSGLPADNIAKIDIISNPSAKYDAQGGTIINIVTKKSKADGFNGAVSAGYTQATLGSYNTNGTFNYRKDKLNVYGNIGYNEKKAERHVSTYTIYDSPSGYSDWESERNVNPESKTASYQLGADYNLSKNQIVGILVNGLNSSRTNSSNNTTDVFDNHQTFADSTLNTKNHLKGHTNQYSFNVNYKAKLDSTGRSINIDLDYVPYRNNSDQYVNTSKISPDRTAVNSFDIFTPSIQNIDIWSGKLDYTYRVGKIWHLESGIKYTAIRSDNRFNYFNTAEGAPVFDISRSSNFKYSENTDAAYTSINGSLGKWVLSGGLRAEYTQTTGNSVILDSINRNNYLKLFPTVSISYKLNDDQLFSLNYNQRIDRPGYLQLNPARSYSTPYSFQQGNPALRAYITTNANLSYTYKQNYTVTLGYSRINGQISNVTVQNNVDKTFYDTQQNIDNITDYSYELQADFYPESWWEINLDWDGEYRTQHSKYVDGYFASHNFATDFTIGQSFTISKELGLKAELRSFYRTPAYQGVLYIDHTNDVNAGFSKSIMNKQGSLKLAFGDILNGNAYRISTNYLNQHNGSYQRNDTRNATLSFSYRFGKTISEARKRSTASEEEKGRANK